MIILIDELLNLFINNIVLFYRPDYFIIALHDCDKLKYMKKKRYELYNQLLSLVVQCVDSMNKYKTNIAQVWIIRILYIYINYILFQYTVYLLSTNIRSKMCSKLKKKKKKKRKEKKERVRILTQI